MPTTYAIPDGRTVMTATTYTGNGSTQTIANTANGVSFKPDFVWAKNRTTAGANHRTFDSVRGASKILYPSLTDAEATDAGGLTSFNSNGFSIGANSINDSGAAFVAWQWQAGQGSSSSNTSGSITSTVSVNATAGFSIATYTGNGSAGATFGHGLGVAPSFVIVKERSNANGWLCYHVSTGNTGYLELDATLAFQTLSTAWNNTSPSSTVVTLGTVSNVNRSGGTFVAYCWAAVKGFSAFGSYTGNGSTDGPFIYTGFRPRYVMVKSTTAAQSWQMYDSSRDLYNQVTYTLFANGSNAESSTNGNFDFLSNGFKLRNGDFAINKSAESYIYMAFAENPFKYANAR